MGIETDTLLCDFFWKTLATSRGYPRLSRLSSSANTDLEIICVIVLVVHSFSISVCLSVFLVSHLCEIFEHQIPLSPQTNQIEWPHKNVRINVPSETRQES